MPEKQLLLNSPWPLLRLRSSVRLERVEGEKPSDIALIIPHFRSFHVTSLMHSAGRKYTFHFTRHLGDS